MSVVEVVVVDGTFTRYSPAVFGLRKEEKRGRGRPRLDPAPAPVLQTEVDLGPVLRDMKRLKPDNPRKAMIDAVLKGESFADVNRDDAMYAVASVITWLTSRRPEMTPEILVEILRPSLAVWAAEPTAEKTLDEEMEKAVIKFESAFENRREKEERDFAAAANIRKGLRFGDKEPTEEVVNGTSRYYSIIQAAKNNFFVWNFGKQDTPLKGEGYRGPIDQGRLFSVCKDFWANSSEGFTLRTYDQGKDKIKADKQIMDEYGSAALQVIGHLDLQDSYFEIETREFHRAMCPLRVTEAERDPVIEEWLSLFGASNVEKFLDWVAAIPQLDRANSALYLEGIKDTGKDLFAEGVARLFRKTGPSKYNRMASSRFNVDMFACPFIWLNEGVDSTIKHSSVFIRDLVGATSHDIEGKNENVDRVVGAIRLYIAANNDFVLSNIANEDLGEGDLPAIVQRFFHVRASDDAVRFLKEHKSDLKSWVIDDRIAKHVLYLAETRSTALAEGKFLVEGEASTIHRALVNRGDKNEIVLEWLVHLMEKPEKVTQVYQAGLPLAFVGGGGVFVNTKAFIDCQSIYRSTKYQGDAKLALLPGVASRILARLAGGRQRRFGNDRFHAVNPERVFEWSERTQIGDLQIMKANLSKPLPGES